MRRFILALFTVVFSGINLFAQLVNPDVSDLVSFSDLLNKCASCELKKFASKECQLVKKQYINTLNSFYAQVAENTIQPTPKPRPCPDAFKCEDLFRMNAIIQVPHTLDIIICNSRGRVFARTIVNKITNERQMSYSKRYKPSLASYMIIGTDMSKVKVDNPEGPPMRRSSKW